MFYIGQYATLTSPFCISSVTKNYLTSRCQVHFELDILPFSDSRILLLLSWYTVVVGTGIPWAARKCLVHSMLEQRVASPGVDKRKGKNDGSARVDKTQETRFNKKNAGRGNKPDTDEHPRK